MHEPERRNLLECPGTGQEKGAAREHIKSPEQTAALLCIAVLIAAMALLFLRIGTRVFPNALTKYVWFDDKTQRSDSDTDAGIDWSERYPYRQEQASHGAGDGIGLSGMETAGGETRTFPEEAAEAFGKLQRRISDGRSNWEDRKNDLETYATSLFPGYYKLSRLTKRYETLLGWEQLTRLDTSGIIMAEDGYMTMIWGQADVRPNAEETVSFSKVCREMGIEFLYVQAPHKICRFEDTELEQLGDCSNRNIDSFLEILSEGGTTYLDLRQNLHQEGLDHHSLYFKTDFHWKPETGLWAARRITEKLEADNGWRLQPDRLSPDCFRKEVYPSFFLGEYGRKMTLLMATAEDISFLYSKEPADLRYQIPDMRIDFTGGSEIFYDMSKVQNIDYYRSHAYSAYMYGNKPLERISNRKAGNEKKLLMLRDSLGSCVAPFLALEFQEVLCVDRRYFDGSIRTLLEKEQPDAVIMLCLPDYEGSRGEGAGKAVFDFR